MLFLGAALFKTGSLAFASLFRRWPLHRLRHRGPSRYHPGFVAGAIAVYMNAGFLGGLIGGLIAGAIAAWIAHFKAPRWLRGLMPVVIIPLVARWPLV